MKRISQAALGVAGTLAALSLAAGAFVYSGGYNIGVDDHHTMLVLALIGQLRDRSIAVRAGAIEVPDLDDPGSIAAGARQYAQHCAGCHLAPGVSRSDLRPGLYPHPPNLVQEEPPDARRAFWTIKHGIKMSAMPAWGKNLDDAAIWDVVAFVRKQPSLAPEAYKQLAQ
jgi:mono/diheme cytochrome c family protein